MAVKTLTQASDKIIIHNYNAENQEDSENQENLIKRGTRIVVHRIIRKKSLKGSSSARAIITLRGNNKKTQSQLPDVPMKRPLKCDPRQICNLPEEQRKSIRAQHPEMSEYFFMTQRDKTKYFHVINLQYRQNVKPTQPPGSAPKKKTIHFKKRFEIQHFKRSERCDQLRSRKSFMQVYVASDKQKSKGLKRTPKVT